MEDFIKRNGLLYSQDLKTLIGVDSQTNDFMGRVPFGVYYIEDEVFSGSNYQSISLPDSVKQIGAGLFENSKRLERVKLPALITDLPPYLFSGCSSLNKITMPNVINGFSEGLFYGCSSLEEIPFRMQINELPENVFAGCSSLKSVVIPNTVTKICSGAFANCSSLESIVLPENLTYLAEDAFEGCSKIRSIRISDSNNLFFIDEETGNLYEKTSDGEKCVYQIIKEQSQEIQMFDNDINPNELMLLDEDEDDDYNVDLGAAEDELASVIIDAPQDSVQEQTTQAVQEEEQSLEDRVAEIMQAEKRSYEHNELSIEELQKIFSKKAEPEPEPESQIEITPAIEVESTIEVEETSIENEPTSEVEPEIEVQVEVPQDFIVKNENLREIQITAEDEDLEKQEEIIEAEKTEEQIRFDSKIQILLDSVEFSQIINVPAQEQFRDDSELFVVAEKVLFDCNGNKIFTPKLQNYCKQVSAIQGFERIILLYGLPVDNDEFMQFYYQQMSQKNVILACDAPSPSKLSDYGKLVCEQSRISLDRDELLQQRKQIATKNSTLVKLVIQDKYE